MGWVSYLEDIKKKAEDLEVIVEQIHLGNIAYTDPNRKNIKLITRAMQKQIRLLEDTMKLLDEDKQKVLNENLYLRDELEKSSRNIQCYINDIKNAQVINEKIRNDVEDEKKKYEYIINLYRQSGVNELLKYLNKLK